MGYDDGVNISIPPIECWIRTKFMNAEDASVEPRLAECQVFGMASVPGQTPLFHVLCDDGAIYWRAPLHALCWRPEAPEAALDDLVLWDSFSYHVHCHQFAMLKSKRMEYVTRAKERLGGVYLFTLDWFGGDSFAGFAEHPGQHKCGHMIKLDNGNFALQPNNRLRVYDPNFVTKPLTYPRRLARHLYSSEQSGKWTTSDDDEYRYGLADAPRA